MNFGIMAECHKGCKISKISSLKFLQLLKTFFDFFNVDPKYLGRGPVADIDR